MYDKYYLKAPSREQLIHNMAWLMFVSAQPPLNLEQWCNSTQYKETVKISCTFA